MLWHSLCSNPELVLLLSLLSLLSSLLFQNFSYPPNQAASVLEANKYTHISAMDIINNPIMIGLEPGIIYVGNISTYL